MDVLYLLTIFAVCFMTVATGSMVRFVLRGMRVEHALIAAAALIAVAACVAIGGYLKPSINLVANIFYSIRDRNISDLAAVLFGLCLGMPWVISMFPNAEEARRRRLARAALACGCIFLALAASVVLVAKNELRFLLSRSGVRTYAAAKVYEPGFKVDVVSRIEGFPVRIVVDEDERVL